MKNLIIFVLAFISLFLFSCKEKKYESNSVLLNKAKEIAYKDGEWEAAKSLAFKARKQDMNDPNARVMFALCLEQCGDRDRAIEEIKVAVNLDPEHFMAQYTKGRMLFKTEIYEDCPDPLEAAKKLKPENHQVILLLAETYAKLENYKGAITNYAILGKSEQYKDKADIYNELGVLFLKKKDYKRAKDLLNKAYELDDEAPAICLNLGIFWDKIAVMCKNKPEKASKAAGNAVKYYDRYIKLISVNPESEPQRQKALERIESLKEISSSDD